MKEHERGCERLRIGERIVVFIGPEGSGKTTIARRLADESEKPYVTTGDIIRNLAANDPGALGEECREMFANHSYLAGETLLRILASRFSQNDVADGLILDGGMRTLEETVSFPEMLKLAQRELPISVVYLDIPREVAIERLLLRGREDDTEEGIDKRLAKFYYQLEERLTVIKSNWNLFRVDATGEINEVYVRVGEELNFGES